MMKMDTVQLAATKRKTKLLKEEADKALRCLYIAVESEVAADVNAKIRAYIAALEDKKP